MKPQYILMLLAALCLLLPTASLAEERGNAGDAMALVAKGGAFYRANGKEKLLAEVNNPKGQFIDRDLYLFVFLANGDGTALAHGANPKLVGKNMLELRDVEGVHFVKRFLEIGQSPAGKGWVNYVWPNPVTKAIEPKSTYIEKFDDIIIGCGIYK